MSATAITRMDRPLDRAEEQLLLEATLRASSANVGAFIVEALSNWPRGADAVCVENLNGKAWTARDVHEEIFCQAATYTDQGVRAGNVVCVGAGLDVAFWIDVAALWMLGAIVAPISSRMSDAELPGLGRLAQPSFTLGCPNPADLAARPLTRSHDGLPRRCQSMAVTGGDSPAVIVFTSGSTGRAKGIVLSHRALLGNALATQMRAGLQASFRMGAAVPFHLISAFSHFLIAIASGATYLGTDRVLTSGDFLRYLTDCRITACAGSPLQVRWLCEAAPQHPAAAQLRWLLSVGDHLSEDLIDQAHVALPACDILVGYGLTEAAGRVSMRIAQPAHAGGDAGVGRPILGCRVSAFNDSGSPLAHGEVGTLHVKSPWLLTGYLGEMDAGHGRAPPEWLYTGDTGYLDASGNVFIVGRDDDLFKVGGLKVSALRIQDALLSLGRFRDVAVTSRDLGMGRVPIVLYVPHDNTALDKGAVKRDLRRILPRNHLPWDFVEVSAIPRTQTGKLDRRRAALLSATSGNSGGRTCTPAS